MTTLRLQQMLFLAVLACFLSMPVVPAHADLPGQHPYYLHALSDLRAARWLIETRPGDAAVGGAEGAAIQSIDAAINDIKQAAIDDGKNLNDHPPVDVPPTAPGHLHQAARILKKVYRDLNHEEDDPMTRGLKHRAMGDVHQAHEDVKQAIFAAEHHM